MGILSREVWVQLVVKESSQASSVSYYQRGCWAGWFFQLTSCNHAGGVSMRQCICTTPCVLLSFETHKAGVILLPYQALLLSSWKKKADFCQSNTQMNSDLE